MTTKLLGKEVEIKTLIKYLKRALSSTINIIAYNEKRNKGYKEVHGKDDEIIITNLERLNDDYNELHELIIIAENYKGIGKENAN
ncbi:hypothetical protein [Dielma fastidiosa]|uniref:hypothetical protein n=1 Tax=Dielma fastidiosa TaxID=1034346 RepID=UPI000E489094|nr:hypothetical protein [Dielma fastidiosa]RHN00866.1 hypothetical protein DWZ33_08525 [Dielma fastidiosa]